MRLRASVCLWGGLCGALFAATPVPEPAKAGMDAVRLKSIPARMQALVDQGKVAGVVTLVQRRGVVAEIDAVGFQDIETRKAMSPDTIFEIMSMTKPVTSAAIMMLMEEGKLSINAPVERYLPEFTNQWMIDARIRDNKGMDREMALKRSPRPITLRDLLTHTSGMREMPPAFMMDIFTRYDKTLAEAVHFYSQQPLEFEPGTKWQYSNTGMATLGRIVEVVSGQPYEKFVEERIFKPLNMSDSFFFPTSEKKGRIASVYTDRGGKLVNLGPGIYRPGAKYPCPECGMFSTASDMAKFIQLFLDQGVVGGKRLLSKSSFEVMTMLHTAGLKIWGAAADRAGFGLGWALSLDEGTFGHGGAFGTEYWANAKTGVVGVVMIQKFPDDAKDLRTEFRSMVNAAIQ